MELFINTEYIQWLNEIKSRIRKAQIKATLAANQEMIIFYYQLGELISLKLNASSWGDKAIGQLAKDLKSEFPAMSGFSRTNLYYMKQFFEFCNRIIVPPVEGQISNEFIPQSGEQLANQILCRLPWGHTKALISKVNSFDELVFYTHEIIANNWSRDIFELQIKNQLYHRQGKSITNFSSTLSEQMAQKAQQTLKDPYLFDFVSLSKPYVERDIETQLVNHISKFLLELGKGFAFLGQQYHIEVAGNDYYIDLLFYHVILKSYVVIELKNTRFIPEYAGKLNFYLSAVDSLIKREDDNPTIGILLCRDKNNIEAEFALRDINKPIGVSEFQLTEILPENLKSSFPSIEELEKGLNLSQESNN